MQTYRLTGTGFELYLEGALWVTCPWDPRVGGFEPFPDDASKLAYIAENYPEAVPMA